MTFRKEADAELLRAALTGYQRVRSDLEERITEIKRQLAGNTRDSKATSPRTRMVSVAARRGAPVHDVAGGSPAKAAHAKKRKMSVEGRARIAEATRKRWEVFRAQKAQDANK
jgi:cell division septum initiation protein DivIVA